MISNKNHTPFRIPEGRVHLAFSGGRSSGLMLKKILENNSSEMERIKVIFTNTGREMNETLDFVRDCSVEFGIEIIWLEYRWNKENGPSVIRVNHNSASRNGEPFENVINNRKFLPNRIARFCTAELKIRTAARWLKSIGWKEYITALGIRADEQHRLGKPQENET